MIQCKMVNYDLILVYKILHELTDCTLSHNLTLQEFNKTRGHPYKLVKCFCSHDIYKHFYTNRVVDLWNRLSNDVISAKSLYSCTCKLRMIISLVNYIPDAVMLLLLLCVFLCVFLYILSIFDSL